MILNLKQSPLKTILVILVAILLIIMAWSTISSSRENKRLKRSINEKLLEIERLESQKITIFESIKKDSLKIIKKDSIILGLSKKEYSLTNRLKQLKNEKIKNYAEYFAGSPSERVRIFSKLATENDSIR